MEIIPYDNFDRCNEEFNRKAGKIALIVFTLTILTSISIYSYYQYNKKMKENK